jgi:hypothetical protein
MINLTRLSVSLSISRKTVVCGRNRLWRDNCSIFLEALRKTYRNLSHNSLCLGRYSNRAPTEYKLELYHLSQLDRYNSEELPHGGAEVQFHAFLTSTINKTEWSASRSGPLYYHRKNPPTHCLGEWVGPRAGLDSLDKRTELRFLGSPVDSLVLG